MPNRKQIDQAYTTAGFIIDACRYMFDELERFTKNPDQPGWQSKFASDQMAEWARWHHAANRDLNAEYCHAVIVTACKLSQQVYTSFYDVSPSVTSHDAIKNIAKQCFDFFTWEIDAIERDTSFAVFQLGSWARRFDEVKLRHGLEFEYGKMLAHATPAPEGEDAPAAAPIFISRPEPKSRTKLPDDPITKSMIREYLESQGHKDVEKYVETIRRTATRERPAGLALAGNRLVYPGEWLRFRFAELSKIKRLS